MSEHSVRVGNAEIIALLDTPMAFPFSRFFPNLPPQELEPYKELYPKAFTPEGNFQTNASCYVVRSGGRAVLVDTGLGPGPHDWLGGVRGRLLEDMQAKGVRPEEIEVVVITHLHVDHVGWNLQREAGSPRPTFPRARYYIPRADWEHFVASPEAARQSGLDQTVAPLQELGVLELFSGEVSLIEGVTTLPTPGHTPGHTSVLVASLGERAIITGDLAHHPAQVEHTDWVPAFDSDPQQAIESRRRVLDMLESEGLVGAFCHFPNPGFGRVIRLEGRRVFRAL